MTEAPSPFACRCPGTDPADLSSPWACHCPETAPYRCPACEVAWLEAELAALRDRIAKHLPGVNVPAWLME